MKKYKNLVGTIVFLLIGAILFVMISYGLRPMDKIFRRARVVGFYGEEEKSLNVVTIGSSAIYRYFNNPYLFKEYNLTSYNFASPQQPITIMENVIDEIKKTQNPEVLIIETRPFNVEEGYKFDETRLKVVTDNMPYSINRLKAVHKHADTFEELLPYYFDIISYHDNWEEFDVENFNFIDNKEKHPLKGWSINTAVKVQANPREVNLTDKLPISGTAEEILKEVLTKCKEEKIPVLFVATPYELSEDEQKRNNTIAAIIKEYGFDFLDCNLYNEEIGLNYQTDFYNRLHTNVVGAEKVTKFIAEYLIENYEFDTNHNKAVVKEWDKAVRKYEKRLEGVRESIAQGVSVENNQDEDADSSE